MDPRLAADLYLSRRNFFGSTGLRLGSLALATLPGAWTGTARAAGETKMNPALAGHAQF